MQILVFSLDAPFRAQVRSRQFFTRTHGFPRCLWRLQFVQQL